MKICMRIIDEYTKHLLYYNPKEKNLSIIYLHVMLFTLIYNK